MIKKGEKKILMRSWGNLFVAFIFLGFCAIGTIIGLCDPNSNYPSGKFFLMWAISVVGFLLGILILTSHTWSYVDYNAKAIIQKGCTLIFFPDDEADVYIDLKDIARVKIKIEGLTHGTEFTPLIYNHKGKKYELEPTEIKRTAFKIVEKIRLAVINETGEEPVIELPTKKDIANLP